MRRGAFGLIGEAMVDGPTGAGDLGVAAGVQDLQRDPAACRVHRLRDRPVLGELLAAGRASAPPGSISPSALGEKPPVMISAGAALGALDVEARDALERPVQRLQPRVHGAHDDAVGEPSWKPRSRGWNRCG